MEKKFSEEESAHICGLDRTYISLMEREEKADHQYHFALASGLDELPSFFWKNIE